MTRGKPLSFDRDEVLEKAMDVFWEKGFSKTGMTELLERMGIQRQSFYNTFGSKEEVFLDAITRYSRGILSRTNLILEQDRHPLENMKELFDMMRGMSETKDGCGCLLGNSIAEFGDSQDAVGELLQKQVHGLYTAFFQAFTRAVENGYIAADKDPKVLATSFLAMTQGMALLSKMGFGDEMLNDVFQVTEELLGG